MTSQRSKRSKKYSVCEKSMNIMVNMIKVSSLSLAKLSLGYGAGTSKSNSTPPSMIGATTELVLPPGAPTKRLLSVEPHKETMKRPSYLMEPPHHEADDINLRAVEYINGVRKRNIVESKKRSAVGDDFILLPPPPVRPSR